MPPHVGPPPHNHSESSGSSGSSGPTGSTGATFSMDSSFSAVITESDAAQTVTGKINVIDPDAGQACLDLARTLGYSTTSDYYKTGEATNTGSYFGSKTIFTLLNNNTQLAVISDGDPYPAKAGAINFTNDLISTRFPELSSIIEQDFEYKFTYRGGDLNSDASYSNFFSTSAMGVQGIFLNGVALYNPSSGNGTVPGTNISGDNTHNLNAVFFERQYGIDESGGHPSPQGNVVNETTGQYHYHDPMFLTSGSWNNETFASSNTYFANDYYTDASGNIDYIRHPDGHSKIVGFCFDGYPIYGPYGYDGSFNPQSIVRLMTTSYQTKATVFNGRPYEYDASLSGYTLSAGAFLDDYEYVPGMGSLDDCNGRFCVTPEYPNGTYAYFVLINEADEPVFPYILGKYSRQQRTVMNGGYPVDNHETGGSVTPTTGTGVFNVSTLGVSKYVSSPINETVVDASYGSFTIDSSGNWSYTMDGPHDEFVTDVSYNDSIRVYSYDGSANRLVTVTITGTNDVPSIGTNNTGSITESSTPLSVSGVLSIADSDAGESAFVAQTDAPGNNGYGKFSIDANGNWTYTMNNAHNGSVAAGATYTDTITVHSVDGSANPVITVTITATASGPTPTILGPNNTDSQCVMYSLNSPAAGEATVSGYSGPDAAAIVIPAQVVSSDGTTTYNVVKIGDYAFQFKNISSVTFNGNNLTSIGTEGFRASSLNSVTLPDSLQTISGYAFYDCPYMTTMHIGPNVTSIGSNLCTAQNMESFNVDAANTSFITDDHGILYHINSSVNHNVSLVAVPAKFSGDANGEFSLGTFTKAGVTYTVTDCNYNSDDQIFRYSNITHLIIGHSVTAVVQSMFYAASPGIVNVTIGNGITNLNSQFNQYGNNLTVLSIGASVTSIDGNAFNNLTSLTIDPANTSFKVQDAILYQKVDAANATVFKVFGTVTNVTIPDTIVIGDASIPVTSISDWLFSDRTSLTAVSIGNNVSYIGCGAFNNTRIESISIPASVTVIEFMAFSNNPSLISVTFAANSQLTTLRSALFDNTKISTINIPNSVVDIQDGVFNICLFLTDVTIPYSVTSMRSNTFSGCALLTDLAIDSANTTYVAQDGIIYQKVDAANAMVAFGLSSLTSANMPSSVSIGAASIPVTSIGEGAFQGCSALTAVTIPDAVTSIGLNAFRSCSALTAVTIPDAVTTIGNSAFFSCSALTAVTIGASVTTIGNNAFTDCTALTAVTIPDAVTSIGNEAFTRCYNVSTMTIPASVTYIGSYAFIWCGYIQSVYFLGDNTNNRYFDNNQFHFRKATDPTNLWYYPGYDENWDSYVSSAPWWDPNDKCPPATAYYIDGKDGWSQYASPNTPPIQFASVTTFVPEGGSGSSLTGDNNVDDQGVTYSLNSPASGQATVSGYTGSATAVSIPSQVSKDGTSYTVTNMDISFFQSINCSSLTIPASVTHIHPFNVGRASTLTNVIVDSANPYYMVKDGLLYKLYTESGNNYATVWGGFNDPTISNTVTVNSVTKGSVTYPVTSIHVDQAPLMFWGATAVIFGDNVTSLGNGDAFHSNIHIVSMTMGANITSIQFRDIQSQFTTLSIGANVTSIASSVFSSITSLTVDPDNTTFKVQDGIFYQKVDAANATIFKVFGTVTNVVIPATIEIGGGEGIPVTYIANNSFYGQKSLTAVTIGSNVKTIGYSAFGDDTSLNNVMFDANSLIEIIHAGAFSYTSMVSFIVPDSVTLFEGCFDGVVSLVELTINNSITTTDSFRGITSLVTLNYPVNHPNFVSDTNGFLYSKIDNDTHLSLVWIPNLIIIGSVTIPAAYDGIPVTSIGDCVFQNQTITSVTNNAPLVTIGDRIFENNMNVETFLIPNTVTSIASMAFFSSGLKSIIIPDSVTVMPTCQGCSKLTSCTIGSGITELNLYSFAGVSMLNELVIGPNVTLINGACLGMTALKDVYFLGNNATSTYDDGQNHDFFGYGQFVQDRTTDPLVSSIASNAVAYYVNGKSGWGVYSSDAPPAGFSDIQTFDPEGSDSAPDHSSGVLNLNGGSVGAVSGGDVNVSAGDANIQSTTGAFALALNGGNAVVTTLNGSVAASVSIGSGKSLSTSAGTFAGALSGAGTLKKTGSDTLTLSGTNSGFSGPIQVTEGTLKALSAASLGSGAIQLGDGLPYNEANVTLVIESTTADETVSNPIHALSDGYNNLSTGAGNRVVTLTGGVTKNATILRLLGSFVVDSDITGSSANSDLLLGDGTTSSADVTLVSGNTYDYNGPTHVYEGSTLTFENGGVALPNSDVTIDAGATLELYYASSGSIDSYTENSVKSLVLNGTLAINLNATLVAGTYTLLNYAPKSGSGSASLSYSGAPNAGSFNVTGNFTASAYTITVSAKPTTYTIGGTVSGLAADKSAILKLRKEGVAVVNGTTVISSNGEFTFNVAGFDSGNHYLVSITTQPEGQTGVITNNSGIISSSNITNISIAFTDNNTPAPSSNVCFPAKTPVMTNLGPVNIEDINPAVHTIRNKKIVAITKTVAHDKNLVRIAKHALGHLYPEKTTLISQNHKVFCQGQMIKAKHLVDDCNVTLVPYNGQVLYNVLLEEHEKMQVNNLIVETLHPEHKVAKLYRFLKNVDAAHHGKFIAAFNKKDLEQRLHR